MVDNQNKQEEEVKVKKNLIPMMVAVAGLFVFGCSRHPVPTVTATPPVSQPAATADTSRVDCPSCDGGWLRKQIAKCPRCKGYGYLIKKGGGDEKN
ncbi:MAG: hypothetical protein AB1352_04610 [Patescibacteria group bacterium]